MLTDTVAAPAPFPGLDATRLFPRLRGRRPSRGLQARQTTAPPGDDPAQRAAAPSGWLVLTAADRALADLGAAFSRTSRWQGDCT